MTSNRTPQTVTFLPPPFLPASLPLCLSADVLPGVDPTVARLKFRRSGELFPAPKETLWRWWSILKLEPLPKPDPDPDPEAEAELEPRV